MKLQNFKHKKAHNGNNNADYEKPFETQEQLQKAIGDKFGRFGHKVSYNYKLGDLR